VLVNGCNLITNLLKITENQFQMSQANKELKMMSLPTLKFVDLMCVAWSFPLFVENSNYALSPSLSL
jgi:hypothetical protein